ncbi:MAG TPA: CvpA family protein [Clostridiales bacterium]|nr:CvpA family protein [Clostridiales bacterium]
MNLMPFVILIVMFLLGINGRTRGVVNYKFPIERIVFSMAVMPYAAVFIKSKMVAFMPEMVAAILGVLIGLVVVFAVFTFLFGRIAKIPEYESTGADKTLGFIVGAVKGFAVMCAIIMLYAIMFADLILPKLVTMNMKENFANNRIENSIEYYRYTVYKVFAKAKSLDVADATSTTKNFYSGKTKIDLKKGAQENFSGKTIVDTTVPGYVRWSTRDYTPEPEKPAEPEQEKK